MAHFKGLQKYFKDISLLPCMQISKEWTKAQGVFALLSVNTAQKSGCF